MSFDIRGAWKYRDLLEEYSELQVRASKKILSLQKERDDARRECEQLNERCNRQKDDLLALRLHCSALENECKGLRVEKEWQCKERKAARAEAKALKKIRWRWLDADHGWWPVEGADIDEMVKKVPYVPYAPKPKEKQVPEA